MKRMRPVPQAKNVDEATMTHAGWKKIDGVWHCPVDEHIESSSVAASALTAGRNRSARDRREPAEMRESLVKSWMALGHTREEAEICANGAPGQ